MTKVLIHFKWNTISIGWFQNWKNHQHFGIWLAVSQLQLLDSLAKWLQVRQKQDEQEWSGDKKYNHSMISAIMKTLPHHHHHHTQFVRLIIRYHFIARWMTKSVSFLSIWLIEQNSQQFNTNFYSIPLFSMHRCICFFTLRMFVLLCHPHECTYLCKILNVCVCAVYGCMTMQCV